MGGVFVAPGNHDFGAAGNFYSEERAQRFEIQAVGIGASPALREKMRRSKTQDLKIIC